MIKVGIRNAGPTGTEATAFVASRVSSAISEYGNNGILELSVVPLFVDGRLIPMESNGHAYQLKIENSQIGASDELKASAPVSRDVSIYFKVSENSSGCATLPVSVWNDAKTRALDNFLILIPLDSDPFTQEQCGVSGNPYRARVKGGKSLFAMDLNSDDGTPHILVSAFEASLGRSNDGPKVNYLFAVINQDNSSEEPKIMGWQTPGSNTSLGKLFSSGGHLSSLLVRSRDSLKSTDVAIRTSAYHDLADALARWIFSTPYAGSDADAARSAIVEKVNEVTESGARASVVLRANSLSDTNHGSPYYFPLGLISESPGFGLKGPFNLVSPLPNQSGSGQCISRWSVVLAPDLRLGDDSFASKNLQDLARANESKWRRKAMTDINEIRQFFSNTPPHQPYPKPSEAEGLIVVAHYAEGRGLFLEESEPFVSRFPRVFPKGSFAFLGVCAAGAPQSSSGIISDLNRGNVDSMIVSPMPLDAAFSVRLAYAFNEVLEENYSSKETPTVAQVYAQAVSKLNESITVSDPSSQLGKQASELMILGNADMKLCRLE